MRWVEWQNVESRSPLMTKRIRHGPVPTSCFHSCSMFHSFLLPLLLSITWFHHVVHRRGAAYNMAFSAEKRVFSVERCNNPEWLSPAPAKSDIWKPVKRFRQRGNANLPKRVPALVSETGTVRMQDADAQSSRLKTRHTAHTSFAKNPNTGFSF
jgi:hypothetical protein